MPNEKIIAFNNRNVEDIIQDIRAETTTQKECITRYTFQSLLLTGALWAFAFKFDTGPRDYVFATCGMVCCTIVSCVMFMVSRMANHKYHTVNRNLGYELHLHRLKDYFLKEHSDKWSAMMLDIGWEEAMCAARVVQATLFNNLYTDRVLNLPRWVGYRGLLDLHWLRTYRVKPEHDPDSYPETELQRKSIYSWYDTRKLIGNDRDYHPGSYLRNIHVILHGVGFLSVGLIWGFYAWACHYGRLDSWQALQIINLFSLKGAYFALFGSFNLMFTVFFMAQARRQRSFRLILQSGLLSIQSSAVVWRIVCTCHILGKECAIYKNKSYMSYTRYTYGLAGEAVKNFYRIHQWLSELEECHADQRKMRQKFDELFPPGKEPQYLEFLPGQEPRKRAGGAWDTWP